MKLSEIEAVGRTKIFTGEMRVYKDMSELNEYIKEVDVYTAEQIQEYAKAIVKELLFEQLWNDRFYANSKIFFDKEVEKICSSIFEEDTKND